MFVATKIHAGLLKVVEKIAHGLPQLMGGSGGVDAAVRSRNEATLCRTIQSVAGKHARTQALG
jgi:hypothetical protein